VTKIIEATNCNRTVLAAAQPMTAAFNSAIADFKDMPLGAVQVLWTGAADGPGQFRLYASLVPIESAFDDNEIPLSALEVDQETGTHLWTLDVRAFGLSLPSGALAAARNDRWRRRHHRYGEEKLMALRELPATLVRTDPGAPLATAAQAATQIRSLAVETTSAPGAPTAILSAVVPPGESWRIVGVEVTSRAHATFRARVAGVDFCLGQTSAAQPTVALPLLGFEPAAAGQTVELEFDQAQGPATLVSARIRYLTA
jgi:hypothetical protein